MTTINPNQMPEDFTLSTTDQLALFLGGSGSSFTGDLIRLIARADQHNRAKLRCAFPYEVAAYEKWMLLAKPTVGNLLAALLDQPASSK